MQYLTVLAGANFRPAEAKAALKAAADRPAPALNLALERDIDNLYDTNAVKVMLSLQDDDTESGWTTPEFIGFVAKADNTEIAMLLDLVEGRVSSLPHLVAFGHIPELERCEIVDFANGVLKPTIVIEFSTGYEVGTVVKSRDDEDEDGEEDYLPNDIRGED